MKFLLAHPDISITGTVADWHDLAPTRHNQIYRNDLAEALRHVADKIANHGASEGSGAGRSGFAGLGFRLKKPIARARAWDLARSLKIDADAISNNGANAGSWWRLEPEKSESGAAA